MTDQTAEAHAGLALVGGDRVKTYPLTEAGLNDALDALGESPNGFAETLSSLGFRGVQNSEAHCPISNYLVAAIEDATDVEIGFGQVTVHSGRPGMEPVAELSLEYDEHDVIEEFVTRFDIGLYPDLIEEDSNA